MKKPIPSLFTICSEFIKNSLVYIKLIKYLSVNGKVLFINSFLANIFISQMPVLMAFISKLIIDSLTSNNLKPFFLSTPALLGIIYLFLLFLQNFGQVFLTFVNENLIETISKNIHIEIMKTSLRLESLFYFENSEFHNRRTIVEESALYLPMNFINFTTDVFSILFTISGMFFLLINFSPLIPIIIILSGIPDIFTQKKGHRLFFEGVKETAENERLKNYYRSVLITKEYAKDIRIYNLKDYFIKKYISTMDNIFQIILPIRKRQIKKSIGTSIITSLGSIIPYIWAIGEALRNNITIGQLVMLMTAIVVIQQQISRTAQTLAGHQDVINSMEELTKWINMEPDLPIIKNSIELRRISSVPPLVKINNLWFKYHGSTKYVFEGLDLELMKGKSLAIVGKNGCGKSTLVKLICRLYDPEKGSIIFDDADIRYLRIQDLRDSIGAIFQDFMQYNLPIRENISFDENVNEIISKRIYNAALASNADNFIRHLPDKYDTVIGKRFRGGIELSIGQWQLLAIARGFFRNAGMVILDEPTAALDVTSEAKIYAHFKKITKDKTALLISHRLSTVRIADRIAVINGGKIVEFGDHKSLILEGGIYSEMFMIQAEHYRLKQEQMV